MFNEINQDIKFLALRSVLFGIKDLIDSRERAIKILVCADWLDVGHLCTSFAFRLCLPNTHTSTGQGQGGLNPGVGGGLAQAVR